MGCVTHPGEPIHRPTDRATHPGGPVDRPTGRATHPGRLVEGRTGRATHPGGSVRLARAVRLLRAGRNPRSLFASDLTVL